MAFLLHRLARHQRRGLGDTCCLHMGSWLERDGRNKHLTISSQTRRSSTVPEYIIRNDHLFLQQVEATVRRVFAKYSSDRSLSDVPIPDREMVAIARSLEDRIQVFRHYNNCPVVGFTKPIVFAPVVHLWRAATSFQKWSFLSAVCLF